MAVAFSISCAHLGRSFGMRQTLMSSSANGRGRPHRVADGASKLARVEAQPGDEVGAYTHAQLVRMNSDFVAAVERAFSRGLERRTDREQA
jgi:hypothetical protein